MRNGATVLTLMVVVAAATIAVGVALVVGHPGSLSLGKGQAPARLLNGFYSYARPGDVQAQIRSAGLDWEVIKRGMPETAIDHLYIAKVPGFSDLGAQGDLWFYFFRDRLMRIHFSPSNPRDYWIRLMQREGARSTPAPIGDDVFVARPNAQVEIWLNMQEPGQYFVGWRDQRLQKEMSYIYD
jgi:hypothetical protein